jgi:DNA-binding XRE family transcriptional regulator
MRGKVKRGKGKVEGGGRGTKPGELKPSDYGIGRRFLVAYYRMSGIEKVRKALGANVRRFRQKAGLSQKRLAEKADLHPVYISHVERGTKAVSVEALWKLSRALQVPMSALFHGI